MWLGVLLEIALQTRQALEVPRVQLKSEGEIVLKAPNLDEVGKTDMCIGPGPRIAMLDGERLNFYLFDLQGHLVAPVRKVADAVLFDDIYLVTLGMNPSGWTTIYSMSGSKQKSSSAQAIVLDRFGKRLSRTRAERDSKGRTWTAFGSFDMKGRLREQVNDDSESQEAKVPHWAATGADGHVAILYVDYVPDHGYLAQPRTPTNFVRILSSEGKTLSCFGIPSNHLYHSIGFDGTTVLLVYQNEFRACSTSGKPLWRSPIPTGKEYNEVWLLNHRIYALDEREHITVFQMPKGY